MHFTNLSKPIHCVVVGPLRRDIMRVYHGTTANGVHFRCDKTLRKIRDRYYRDSMDADITNDILSCLCSNENNPHHRKSSDHLQPISPPEGVWQMLSMDFHGPITLISRRGNRYIISHTVP
jgi:Integrase zinc binding domain